MEKGFCYEQSTGAFWLINGDYQCPLCVGSAGRSSGRNNPEADDQRGVGPLPRGYYRLRVVSHPRFHAPAIRLDPEAETDLKGRGGFYIHGGTQSEGCILIQRAERAIIADLCRIGWDRLKVVR